MQPRQSLTLDEIQLSTAEFWMLSRPEREAAFATLRAERPVAFYPEFDYQGLMPPGPGYWAVTRHADILHVSRNAEIFCSGRGVNITDLPQQMNEFFGSMISMDDPRHGRLRRIVSRGFTPRALGRLEADVQRRASRVIDRVIEKGECDFVTEIAAPLPLEIICDLMGIPESDAGFVFDRTNVILGLGDPEYVAPGVNPIAAALTAGSELANLMKDLAKERTARPKDDLTSALLNAEVDGDTLSEAELASFFVLLVVAGNETTRNAISHGMLALCQHPDERARWQRDFEALQETAIEEIVRWASPVIHFRRTVTRDTELAGQPLREGEKVVLFYNSGNRDEAVFDEPFRFDLSREPNEHVGYGGPGPHHCLGANLARREIRVMFREILSRLPDLEVTGEPEWLASNFIHGIKHMPCRFTPGGGD